MSSVQEKSANEQHHLGTGKTVAAEGEELSDYEKYISGRAPETLSFDIKQFGYDLFLKSPGMLSQGLSSSAEASSVSGLIGYGGTRNTPIGPDYVLGPGDEVRVNLWGSIESVWNVTVDRDGAVSLPKIGTIGLAGLTFKEAKDTIYKELSKQFTDFEMNMTLGQLRSIQVYVVGKARKPGAYIVSSVSTLLNALYESGGPSKVGSMRDIQLKRNGETLVHFDLYDFLLTGSRKSDVRLMQDDVIFIPDIGPISGIAGNVKSPAIYELKQRTRVSDLVKMAGGVTARAYLQRVQVERVSNRNSRVILDLNLQQLKGKEDIIIEDGDIVKVFPVNMLLTNKVILKGNVMRPGQYEWRPGMRVRDIIRSTDDLLPETLMENARVDRLIPPDYHMEYRNVNLGRLLLEGDESENLLLQPQDELVVFQKWEVREREKVRTAGALNRPGEYDYRKNMTLSDLVKLSGGLKHYAMLESAELTRVTPTSEGPKTEKIVVNLKGAMDGNSLDDLILKENDYLFVRTVPEWDLYKTVSIAGEVMHPGMYTFQKGEKLCSVLSRAGGYTSQAYLPGAVFTRKSVQALQQQQIKQMVERLQMELMASGTANISTAATPDEAKILAEESRQKAKFLEGLEKVEAKGRMIIRLADLERIKGTPDDMELEDGDTIFIPTNPGTVQVVGAVYNQSAFLYQKGSGPSQYIALSGGYTKTADKKSTYIIKSNGMAVKPKGGLAWNRSSNSWESGYAGVDPGDTIVVPEQLERFAWMRNIKDVSQILFQVATSAGLVFVGL